MDIGGRRGLEKGVIALHALELFQVAAGDCELMGIQHCQGPVIPAELGKGLGFRRLQQQVVAVHVQAVGSGAPSGGSPIGIGTWHQQYVDLVEDRRQRALF